MIFGERIRFRGVERDDLATFINWVNDPEVLRGTGIYLPLSMADEQDWFETMRKKPMDEHNLAIEVSWKQLKTGSESRLEADRQLQFFQS